MRKENLVSIWVGNFNSEDDFDEYIGENYDEDGDMVPSIFMNDFEMGHIDHDFQESEFFDKKLTKDDIVDFSYAETFIDKINEANLMGNAIILLYDFEYSGEVQTKNNVNYIGAYDYKK